MALDAILDAIDTLPEPVRALYKPIGEGDFKGKFILDVAPASGFALENVTGLKSAYSAQKTEAETLKAALKGYEGIKDKPSEIAAKLKKLQELEAFDPESEADKRAAVKAKGQIDAVVAKHEEERGVLESRASKAQSQVERLLVREAAITAATRQKGDPDLLMPFILSRVRVKSDGDGDGDPVVEVLDEKGAVDFAVKDGKPVPMTIDDLVGKMKTDQKYGRLFESGQSGTGAKPSNGSGGSKTITRQQFEALDPASKQTTIRTHTIVD